MPDQVDPETVRVIVGHRIKKRPVARWVGDKKSPICPRCGGPTFGYPPRGIYKRCTSCGYLNYYEKKVRHIRRILESGRPLDSQEIAVLNNEVVPYLKTLRPLEGVP